MDAFFNADWIAIFALAVTCLVFEGLYVLTKRINWTFVLLIALALGLGIGIVFSFDDGAHLTWLSFIGTAYVNIITALVAPIVLISVLSGFMSLGDKTKMKSIGLRSVLWLMTGTAMAIVLSIIVGLVFGLGKGAGSFFADMSGVSDAEISAYEGLQSGFDQVLLALLPTNIVGDLSSNNVVAIIIIAVAFAIAYVSIVSDEGEKGVKAFKDLVEAVKKVLYRVLRYVINLTPYAALCLIATSAAQFISDRDAMMQLLLLLVLVYACGFFHEYVLNIPLIKFAAKLKPLKFFKKILPAQITAFSTSSSVGTIPVSVEGLTKRVGVDEEVANFTVPLGATIGMPGCTAVWPILLAIFYVNATGLNWGVSEYIMLGVLALVLSFGVAGVPGIGVVSAISLFSAVHLPVAAVIMMLPINTITDMIRTMMNVTTANVSATIVARQTGLLDDSVFENANDKEA